LKGRREQKGDEMNTQTESKQNIEASKSVNEFDNPMQERPSVMVDERDVLAAEAVFAARRLEARQEAGYTSTILFVP